MENKKIAKRLTAALVAGMLLQPLLVVVTSSAYADDGGDSSGDGSFTSADSGGVSDASQVVSNASSSGSSDDNGGFSADNSGGASAASQLIAAASSPGQGGVFDGNRNPPADNLPTDVCSMYGGSDYNACRLGRQLQPCTGLTGSNLLACRYGRQTGRRSGALGPSAGALIAFFLGLTLAERRRRGPSARAARPVAS